MRAPGRLQVRSGSPFILMLLLLLLNCSRGCVAWRPGRLHGASAEQSPISSDGQGTKAMCHRLRGFKKILYGGIPQPDYSARAYNFIHD